jgi:hypothetical protein
MNKKLVRAISVPQVTGLDDEMVYFEVNEDGKLYISQEFGEPLLFEPEEAAHIADFILRATES